MIAVVTNMADKPSFEYSPESVHDSTAGSTSGGRKQSGNKLAAPENWQQASRKPSKQPLMETGQDKSRSTSAISLDPRGGSGAGDDQDGADERQDITLEERLARDRIMHLHDVFVSAQSSEGLSMEEFRSAMRQVILDESGRIMEDDELDKVRVTH